MREGRSALHTSVAAYKFLITYGLLFSVLKLTCYLLGVIMCQAAYMLIEGIAIIVLPWATTLALPAKKLGKVRGERGGGRHGTRMPCGDRWARGRGAGRPPKNGAARPAGALAGAPPLATPRPTSPSLLPSRLSSAPPTASCPA